MAIYILIKGTAIHIFFVFYTFFYYIIINHFGDDKQSQFLVG